jgi:hypothetical protein
VQKFPAPDDSADRTTNPAADFFIWQGAEQEDFGGRPGNA